MSISLHFLNFDKNTRNPILKQCFKYIILAFICSVLMQIDDAIQQLFTESNGAKFEFKFALSLFGFHLLLWLGGNRSLAIIILVFFGLLQFSQLLHISYVGRPIDPTTISSIFSESKDISQSVTYTWRNHLHLILAVILPYGLNIYLYWKLLPKKINNWVSSVCFLGIFLILASKPYRATYRDLNMFLPGPTRPSLYNTLDTYSFFLIKGFPSIEEVMPKAEIPPPSLSKVNSNANTVWLVIVDSLRYDHLQAFGYERENTPLINEWFNKGLTKHKGVAAAVATAASVPLIMNAIHDPGNINQIKSAETNLFKLAKSAGYETTWISSQSSRVLNDLGVPYIDKLISEEDAPLLFEKEKDEGIFKFLKDFDSSKKQFVVILLRGAHSPYEENYEHRKEFRRWEDEDALKREIRDVNSYDNSVLYIDSILDRLLTKIQALPGENHVVITSDHGQLLGEENLWGHNILRREIAKVPIFSASWNEPEGQDFQTYFQGKAWVSHFEMSKWVAEKLGTSITYPQYNPEKAYFQGKNLYGFNQFIEVKLDNKEKLQLSEPVITPDYVPTVNHN
ncbi:sulfatase-like hydrolase/transferase [Thorsellia kenyensis]|uniref:Sulfatase-like hydrolase/transferase n=1 Tax=Thorsellia kenyensis TaxID=1549888 RepID=A0ABV6CA32_9GAMM